MGSGQRGSGLRAPSRRLGIKCLDHLEPPPRLQAPTQPPPHPPFHCSPPYIRPPPGIPQCFSTPPPLYNAYGHGRKISNGHCSPSVGLHPHQDQSRPGRGHRGGGPPPHSRGRPSYSSTPGRTRHPTLPPLTSRFPHLLPLLYITLSNRSPTSNFRRWSSNRGQNPDLGRQKHLPLSSTRRSLTSFLVRDRGRL